jgi:tetratricopeptide (TPR) repeat protein
MTWRGPNDLERFVLRQPLDARVLALARALVLAPRIEPLLLRNARLAFLPAAGAELEARLWRSPLVAARGSAEIVLHLGIAAVLAGGLQGVARAADAPPADGDDLALPDDPATAPLHLDTLWAFTREQTRHWPAADRLERDLRYHALRGDDQALAHGLGSLLAEIAREGDEARRISLSRLAKRTLPGIRRRLGPAAEAQARQLARYAALALQDGGGWSDAAGEPAALPRWLAERLPPPLAQAELGVAVRGGADNPVLHLLDPTTADTPVIALPSPLPARLHVRAGGAEGAWHSITRGTCIPLDPPGTLIELTTLTGRRWLLQAELPRAEAADQLAAAAPPPLRLVHAAADEAAAKAIADWLRGQGIPIELLAETEPARIAPRADQARAVRLWTSAARALWANAGADPPADDTGGLLLRTEDVAPPGSSGTTGPLLDWLDWQRLGESPTAADLAKALDRWWREGVLPAATEADESEIPAAGAKGARGPEADADADRIGEIQRLLDDIADPKTEPPRRLEIGDRLDELGDPRPGVGTVEIEVPIEAPAASDAVEALRIRPEPIHPPDFQALLAEIANPATEPPRRLAIGDRLAEPAPGTENLLVAVLRLLAFFDRPADEGAIRALLKAPAIAGLTDTLSGLSRSDWRMAVNRLVDLGWVERSGGPQTASGLDVDDPPVADDPKGGTWLDTHPLIRSYLATQVKESRPDAWREGHRRLFEHFSFRAAGVHLPSDIAGLQPLYRAMAHACRAGLHQRALKEVYVPRILRGTDLTGFFVTKKLGAFEDDLQGIACFFEDPWERVSPLLSIGDQAFLLGVASHDLQALRRFEEAEGPMRSALDVYLRQAGVPDEQWRANYLRSAAIMANQLSDLNLTLGRLADARADIEQCVDLAKRSGDSFLSEVALTSLGDVLHQQGDFDGAWKAFAEAEAERDAVHPRMSILISLQGYEYCDLILAGAERTAWRLFLSPQREGVSAAEIEEEVAACAEVARRCRLIRRWRETGEWNPESVGAIDIAVEQLGLGRALLLRLLLEPTLPRTDDPRWAGARAELAKALDTFRSGHENHLPSALLPIAWLSTATGDLAAARRALDEAWETVTQPGMRLQMVDTLLYRARLNRDSADLVKARSLIDDLQYGRRRQELADSETFARAW